MYWSVWEPRGLHSGKQGSIEKAWMDGSHRETLVTGLLKIGVEHHHA